MDSTPAGLAGLGIIIYEEPWRAEIDAVSDGHSMFASPDAASIKEAA